MPMPTRIAPFQLSLSKAISPNPGRVRVLPNPKPDPVPRTMMTKSKELYITTEPISKLYTDDMGRLPVRSRSGNNFIMLS